VTADTKKAKVTKPVKIHSFGLLSVPGHPSSIGTSNKIMQRIKGDIEKWNKKGIEKRKDISD